ncbi:Trehalose synthase [ANME-1 cluster archaeon GoMg3.2]|nr:Trehalose synthase [ANME-1 cluster archaeon GoMg3.2]
MKKIKVVMLGPYLYEMGGVTMHIKKMTKYLSYREDIEMHLITIGNKNEKTKIGNLNIHMIKKSLPYPFSIPSLVWFLKHKIIELNPDIVHAQGSFAPYSTAAALVRNKYPTLLTMHGILAKELKFHKGINFIFILFIHKPNERYVVSKISNIIAVSLHVKNVISDMTQSQICVIQNGIDFEDIHNVQPHKSVEYPSILFVGGLSKVKGIDTLLNAVPILRKKILNLCLYIAGSGPEENKLKELVKELNIEENVNFLGYVSEIEKYSYYKSADVCVFPSIYEPFGIVLLEAMACGKPVVASNVGGIPFVVEEGKTGLLFESGNVEDLADKIMTILKNEELREKMGEAGRERAKEFTWDKIAERTVDVYKEILKGK